jgi:hypothetical protein
LHHGEITVPTNTLAPPTLPPTHRKLGTTAPTPRHHHTNTYTYTTTPIHNVHLGADGVLGHLPQQAHGVPQVVRRPHVVVQEVAVPRVPRMQEEGGIWDHLSVLAQVQAQTQRI